MPDTRPSLSSRSRRQRKVRIGGRQSKQYDSGSSDEYSPSKSRQRTSYKDNSTSSGYMKTRSQTRNAQKSNSNDYFKGKNSKSGHTHKEKHKSKNKKKSSNNKHSKTTRKGFFDDYNYGSQDDSESQVSDSEHSEISSIDSSPNISTIGDGMRNNNSRNKSKNKSKQVTIGHQLPSIPVHSNNNTSESKEWPAIQKGATKSVHSNSGKEYKVGVHGRMCGYKNVPTVVKRKQEIARSTLNAKSIDCRLCDNKFHLACMKYHNHTKMLNRALTSKKSSKIKFICDQCLPSVGNKDDATDQNVKHESAFVIGLSNSEKIKSIRNGALARDSETLSIDALENKYVINIEKNDGGDKFEDKRDESILNDERCLLQELVESGVFEEDNDHDKHQNKEKEKEKQVEEKDNNKQVK